VHALRHVPLMRRDQADLAATWLVTCRWVQYSKCASPWMQSVPHVVLASWSILMKQPPHTRYPCWTASPFTTAACALTMGASRHEQQQQSRPPKPGQTSSNPAHKHSMPWLHLSRHPVPSSKPTNFSSHSSRTTISPHHLTDWAPVY
jgi:hypothetical protein